MNTKMVRYMLGALLLAAPTIGLAQDNRLLSAAGDKYVISATAGGVNYTEGPVTISRLNGRSGPLLKGDSIGIGDSVRTGDSAKAEVLLNPGSYLRVGENSEFQFISTSLDDLRVRLLHGSAIFEVIADNDFRVTLKMPNDEISITRSGVYRFDVSANGETAASVIKGRLDLDNDTRVKSGRRAVVRNGVASVAKFDDDAVDELADWSKDRAKELSKINAGLQRRAMRTSLLNSFNRNSWNFYQSFGLWVFDPFRASWCFLPFGSGWGSPYGYGYGFDIWRSGIPIWIYNQPPPGPVKPRTPTEPPTTGGVGGRRPIARPPFKTIERNDNGGIVRRRPMPRDDSPEFTGFPRIIMPPAAAGAPTSGAVPPAKGKP